jgi:calcium-dependent protein kinase
VHRDLKPENILIERCSDKQMSVKIIDFGTAGVFSPNKKMKDVYGTSYYVAPEVLFHYYSEKCDIWSLGVILFILLCGNPPFGGVTDDEIVKSVKKTHFAFNNPIWKNVSDEAKDLISNMIKYPPELRFSAEQALNHKWLRNKKVRKLNPVIGMQVLTNMKTFRAEQKLQQAALMFLVTQMANRKEKEELQNAFAAIDKNGDGKLSKDELLECYVNVLKDQEKATKEVDQMMQNVDIDHNGYIDYSGIFINVMIFNRVYIGHN